VGPYVIIFYVFGGDQVNGATYVGLFGTVLSACTFGAIYVVTWLATKVGKKRAFILSTTVAIPGRI
jgi:GPH family glycoside/pentoside/hexuronide:cation symporter